MHLNEIVRELELPPNSLVKINDIKNFHDNLMNLLDKSNEYLIYLENDYVEKTFSAIENLTFARDFYMPFKVYVYDSLIGELDLKKQRLVLAQVQTNEEMFYTNVSLAIQLFNQRIDNINKSIETLRQKKQSLHSGTFFLKLFINSNQVETFQQIINEKEEKKKNLLSQITKLNSMWKKCFDDRLSVVEKLRSQCLNNNIKVELGEIDDEVPIDAIIEQYITAPYIFCPKLKTNHKGIKTME